MPNPEIQRLIEHRTFQSNWKKWGPYLSDRAWGTVREDYSNVGNVWRFFPHEHARSRVYRWNEDGLAGISDRNQYLCFALALWNHKDPILKERLFGLAGDEGNHGEDVKEYYFYLDNTPTHSYMKMLYKYPQNRFPYEKLREENSKRDFEDLEYELIDTGIFDNNAYFDVFVEYAKAEKENILIEITVNNRFSQEAQCDILPTIWFRNTWSWGYPAGPMGDVPTKPSMRLKSPQCLQADHPTLGMYYLAVENDAEWIFTENETNNSLLYHTPNSSPYVKDAFHRYLVNGEKEAVNPTQTGTKAAALHRVTIPAEGKATIRLRLSHKLLKEPFKRFDEIMSLRKKEADKFYGAIQRSDLCPEEKMIQRQAFAGLLWSKQLYYFDVEHWLKDDAEALSMPLYRHIKRNKGWQHLVNFDIISMPDKWEYPWYACWDLAFHSVALVLVDPDFAKRQLELMTREWYMHPNGQLPAYEWNFYDVNPPVHAWAALRVYQIDAKVTGKKDRRFLEGLFHKLLLNFTWWVNRKDREDNNVFQGGFLGLDNISVFDRSNPLPTGGYIDQADGTAWMGFYCVNMMKIALELAEDEPVYQDSASKFFEHFQMIARAMNSLGDQGHRLWDEEDGFFYDALHLPQGEIMPLKVRSLVGLLPLFAIEAIDSEVFQKAPTFEKRLKWFTHKHPTDECGMACIYEPGEQHARQMAILKADQLRRVLKRVFDENEFLSEYGIRSLSKYHKEHPYVFQKDNMHLEVGYEPAESRSGLFGGNSNWRGPIWFPINYLLIEALQRYHHYYKDSFKVEFPTGSGVYMDLKEIARELSRRLIKLFLPDKNGRRPIFGGTKKFQEDPHWKEYLLFYEYFHGDNGAGIGASHQTGWTALVAKLIQQSGE